AGVAAKFAPRLNGAFMGLTILGSVFVGLLMALTSDYAAAIEVGLGFALVAGAAGYAMRMRGFTERLQSD
ncbi:MAG: hypothetical protein OEM96_10075, partial [Gemmatimonadota bacterium]|nr:hypothetical protein [Gemmatimonadota bacterium]